MNNYYSLLTKLRFITLVVMFFATPNFAMADTNMQIVGLFKNKVIIMLDGKQQVLNIGDTTAEGLTLIRSSSNSAIFSQHGKEVEYHLSTHINSSYKSFTAIPKKIVQVALNADGQYLTKIKINNKVIDALIDTGANTISLSSTQARQLKLDYSRGEITKISTAGGEAAGYIIALEEVALGDITVKQVTATVIEGNEPKTALLGMSFLKQVNMHFDEKTKILEIKE